MFLKAYTLLDAKAGLFSAPWFLPNDVSAVRAVRELGRDGGTIVGKYPADFVLFCVGEFDDNAGVLSSPLPHRNLGVVAALLNGGDRETA